MPSQVIEGFKLTETAEGKLVYALEAETARVFDDSNRIEVVRPEVHFFNEKQELFSTLFSQTGTVNTKTSDLVARETSGFRPGTAHIWKPILLSGATRSRL